MHLNAARENAEKFSELAKEVEVFPRKVASALRLKAEPQGFFESVWTGLEECVCTEITGPHMTDITDRILGCACLYGMSVRPHFQAGCSAAG